MTKEAGDQQIFTHKSFGLDKLQKIANYYRQKGLQVPEDIQHLIIVRSNQSEPTQPENPKPKKGSGSKETKKSKNNRFQY